MQIDRVQNDDSSGVSRRVSGVNEKSCERDLEGSIGKKRVQLSTLHLSLHSYCLLIYQKQHH